MRKHAAVPVVFAVVMLAASWPLPVRGDAVVGTGTPDSCNELALDTALGCNPSGTCIGKGNVTFNCGGGPVTITVTSLERIVGEASIDGGGLVTLDCGGTTPLFTVDLDGILSLTNLIVSGGKGGTAGVISISGGGTLTVTNSTFSGNSGITSGAIFNSSGTLTVSKSTFTHNSADAADGGLGGGAIFNNGTLIVTDSTFTDNSVNAGHGGAILSNGTLIVTNSTFSGNSARYVDGLGGNGGAVASINAFAEVNVTNSTFSGNSANHGGAIYWSGNPLGPIGHPVTVTNTVLANSTGGNCYVKPDSIIVGGTGNTGVITNGGYNLEDGESCEFRTANGSMSNTNPDLDQAGLANNGGPTQTIALVASSPAINAADDSKCPTTDQRGFARPLGAHCDIGAFEGFVAPPPSATFTPTRTPIVPTSTRTWTSGPTPTRGPCYGDADGNGRVTVNEIVLAVNCALERVSGVQNCGRADVNGNGVVTVDELIKAVNAALNGCVG